MAKIQIKRGLQANIPALDVGELALCTDTGAVYIGTSQGNVPVGGGEGGIKLWEAQVRSNLYDLRRYSEVYKVHNSEFPSIDMGTSELTSAGSFQHLSNAVVSFNPVNGAMLMVFRGGTNHVSAGSKFYQRRSIDGGKTWSTAEQLPGVTFTASIDYRNAGGGYTPSGRFVLMYDKYVNPNHSHLYFIYSDNDGVSWSTEALAASDQSYDLSLTSLVNNVIAFEDGRIGIPYYQTKATGLLRKFGITVSDDGGQTFTAYRESEALSEASFGKIAEPTMVQLTDQVILCIQRDIHVAAGYEGKLFQHISYDGGFTWQFQGRPDFDSIVYQTNSDDQFLPKLHLVNIFGQKVVALYYTKRLTNEVKVIYALPRHLTGQGGHLRWCKPSLNNFFNWTYSQSIDGNGSALHPNGNFRGIFVAEDQNTSSDAHLFVKRTPNNIVDVAMKLGIERHDLAIEFRGSSIDFAPYYIGQICYDLTNNINYIAHGTTSPGDWVAFT